MSHMVLGRKLPIVYEGRMARFVAIEIVVSELLVDWANCREGVNGLMHTTIHMNV